MMMSMFMYEIGNVLYIMSAKLFTFMYIRMGISIPVCNVIYALTLFATIYVVGRIMHVGIRFALKGIKVIRNTCTNAIHNV